jgi:hypothetical protein
VGVSEVCTDHAGPLPGLRARPLPEGEVTENCASRDTYFSTGAKLRHRCMSPYRASGAKAASSGPASDQTRSTPSWLPATIVLPSPLTPTEYTKSPAPA